MPSCSCDITGHAKLWTRHQNCIASLLFKSVKSIHVCRHTEKMLATLACVCDRSFRNCQYIALYILCNCFLLKILSLACKDVICNKERLVNNLLQDTASSSALVVTRRNNISQAPSPLSRGLQTRDRGVMISDQWCGSAGVPGTLILTRHLNGPMSTPHSTSTILISL